jgi:hypothetical protein
MDSSHDLNRPGAKRFRFKLTNFNIAKVDPNSLYQVCGSGLITDRIATNACRPPDPTYCGWSITPDHWELCNGTVLGSPSYQATWAGIYVNGSTAPVTLGATVTKWRDRTMRIFGPLLAGLLLLAPSSFRTG